MHLDAQPAGTPIVIIKRPKSEALGRKSCDARKKFDKKLFRSPVAVVAAVEYFVDYPAEDRVLHCREYKSDQLEIIQRCEEQ